MKLNTIFDKASIKKKKRIGRGIGSGTGKTSGAGHKGQKARSGVAIKGFEGGQMPLHRRLPKRGFNSPFRKRYVELGFDKIEEAIKQKKIDNLKEINETVLLSCGLVNKLRDGVKILANGVLKSKINITVTKASKSAVLAIKNNGGNINLTIQEEKKE